MNSYLSFALILSCLAAKSLSAPDAPHALGYSSGRPSNTYLPSSRGGSSAQGRSAGGFGDSSSSSSGQGLLGGGSSFSGSFGGQTDTSASGRSNSAPSQNYQTPSRSSAASGRSFGGQGLNQAYGAPASSDYLPPDQGPSVIENRSNQGRSFGGSQSSSFRSQAGGQSNGHGHAGSFGRQSGGVPDTIPQGYDSQGGYAY